MWADGSKSMVCPQDIYVPGEWGDDSATGSDGSNGANGWGTSEEDLTSEDGWGTSEDMTKDHGIENLVDSVPEIEELAKLTSRCDGEEQEAAEVSDLLQTAETLCNFKPPVTNASETFQVLVSVPSDHHFLGSQNQNADHKWLRKVQLDWGILQNDLPGYICTSL